MRRSLEFRDKARTKTCRGGCLNEPQNRSRLVKKHQRGPHKHISLHCNMSLSRSSRYTWAKSFMINNLKILNTDYLSKLKLENRTMLDSFRKNLESHYRLISIYNPFCSHFENIYFFLFQVKKSKSWLAIMSARHEDGKKWFSNVEFWFLKNS